MANATIAEELTCPVCLEFYKDPRLLPCHHSLCKSCLLALCSKKKNDNDCELQCPSCRHLFQAMDETHIESLPKNFTLASIVLKFLESMKGDKVIPCDLCEEGQKGRAIKKCLQCQFNYCRMCLEQLHPKRGAMASHKLIHVVDAYAEGDEKVESISACLSSASDNQSVVPQKYDHQKRVRYCLSCDEVCAEEDQHATEGNRLDHDMTEIESAFRRKKEEFECILASLMDEDLDLEKGLAHISSLIETIRQRVEEKKVELVQRFVDVAKEVESRKMLAEKRIEEEMNMRLTSLQSCLHELEDLKVKTQIKIAAFSELFSLTDEDASIFLIKLKKLRNEIGPVTGDYMKQAKIGPECDFLLPIERSMNDIIANAICGTCPSERSLKVYELYYLSSYIDLESHSANMDSGLQSMLTGRLKNPNLTEDYIASSNAIMAIKVTNVQKEGTMSADIEWVAVDQVDHYAVSYSCDPEETVLRRNIVANRCRLTNLRWDSEYTITVLAYMPDGKTSFDSTVFKTDPRVKDSNMANMDIASTTAIMAIKVTSVQKEGTMSADVEWVAVDQVDHYEISYSCNPRETVLQQNIMENRCTLTNLKWDSEYKITVMAYMMDGKTSFDSAVFKTDPKVKDTGPAILDLSPKHMYMAINVTNDQKGGTMSADVEWQPTHHAGHYEVSYHCNPDETVVLNTFAVSRCRLTHLQWNAAYIIKLTTKLRDGRTVFDQHSFNTDSQVKYKVYATPSLNMEEILTYKLSKGSVVWKVSGNNSGSRSEQSLKSQGYPMAVSEICNKKISVPDSFNEFTASNRIKKWVDFHDVGDFSGVVFTPVLTEEKHFWTMNIELSIFEEESESDEFLDFGIVNYSDVGQCEGLTDNSAAYSCTISTSRNGNFLLRFQNPSCLENRVYLLPLKLFQKEHFCYGFMYDKINRQFAVMDCLKQKVLHVFHGVTFKNNQPPIFAVCPYHHEVKMRVAVKLDHMHCSKENVSCWIRRINAF